MLNSIVQEFVDSAVVHDQTRLDGFAELRMHRVLGAPLNERQQVDFRSAAKARESLDRFLGGG